MKPAPGYNAEPLRTVWRVASRKGNAVDPERDYDNEPAAIRAETRARHAGKEAFRYQVEVWE